MHPAAIVQELSAGRKRIAAYVVSNREITPQSLREYLQSLLPDYMIPAVFTFIESLPLSPNGKIDRASLPAPDDALPDSESFVAPRTDIERRLADIWSAILEIERIGVHDNFFELGGHSLLATRLISRIRTLFDILLPLHSLFDYPTNRSTIRPHRT